MKKNWLIALSATMLSALTLGVMSICGVFTPSVSAETTPTSYGLYLQGAAYDNNNDCKTFTWQTTDNSVITINDGDNVQGKNTGDKVSAYGSNTMNVSSDGTGTIWYNQYGQPEYYFAGLPGGAYRGYELALTEAITVSDYDYFTFDVLMNVNGSSSADQATQFEQQKAQLRGNAKDFPVWVYFYGSNGTENVSKLVKTANYGIDFYTSVNVPLADSGLVSIERIAIATHYANGWNITPQLDGGDYFTLTNFNVVVADKVPNKTLSVNDSAYSIDNADSNILLSVLDGYTSAKMTRGALAYGKDPVPNSDYKYQTGRISTGKYVTILFEEPIDTNHYKYADFNLMIWPQGAEGSYLAETATSYTLKMMKYATTSLDNALDTITLNRATWKNVRIDLSKYADTDGYVNRISIAYVDNNAYGHAEGTTQSQYSINIVTHDISLIGKLSLTYEGVDVAPTQTLYCGDSVSSLEKPTKNGYTFVGWTVNGDPAYTLTDNATLKANWVEDAPTDYMLYQNATTLSAVGGGKSFTWLEPNSADRVLKHNGNYIRGGLNLATNADSQFSENAAVKGETPTNTIVYQTYNASEAFYCGVPGGAVTGFEAKLNDLIFVEKYPLLTFEIGWIKTTKIITDAKAYVYAYGSNGTENTQALVGEVTYGTDVFSTAYCNLADSGLETVSRIAIVIDFATLWNAEKLDAHGNVYMQNFTVHTAKAVQDATVLTATNGDMWAYNGNEMNGLLTDATHAKMYRANDGSVAVGGNINGVAVANTEYKFATNRITTGKYVVMTFRQPINVNEYEGVGLRMWVHPQGAEGNYLQETATSFTFKVLRYDATDTNGGKSFALPRTRWTEMVLPLADFADDKGYVERLIILYADNNAYGHADGTTQSQYTINMMMHSAVLYTDVEYTVTFDTDGGSAVASQTVIRGGVAQEPVAPTKHNYIFNGWTLNDTAYNFSTVLTGDVTLKASWTFKTLGETLATMNVNLGGKISATFKYALPTTIVADTNAYVAMTVNGRTTQTLVKDAITDGEYHFFTVEVAAAEMTKAITVQLFDGDGGEGTIYSRSIKDYADYMLANGTPAQVDMVKAMVNYGAYAQLRFGIDTDNLVNAGYEMDISGVTVNASKVETGVATGFTFASYDLILESETTLRLYFNVADIENYDITVAYDDGTVRVFTLVPAYDDVNDRYYVDIPNIAAPLLDREYTVSVTNKTDNSQYSVTLSALCYISDVLESDATSEAQKNVVKALYLYNQAANTFFEV